MRSRRSGGIASSCLAALLWTFTRQGMFQFRRANVLSFSHLAPRHHDLGSLLAGERIIGVGQVGDDADHPAGDGKRYFVARLDSRLALDTLWHNQLGFSNYHNGHSKTAIAGHFSR
jgi:hypothetical protein